MFELSLKIWGVVALLASFYIVKKLHKAYVTPLARIPSPWYAPFTNLRLKAAVMSGTRVHYIHQLHERYGSIVRLSPDEISVSDVQAFKDIHRIGGGFTKSPWYENLNSGGPDSPMGVFNMINVKQHSARRRLLARGFAQNHLREQWEVVVREKVELAVSRIKEDCERHGSADLLQWWMLMASDVSATLMFGDSFHCLESGKKADYITAIEKAGLASAFLAELRPLYWLGRVIPLPAFRSIFHANGYLMERGKQAVVNSRASSATTNIFATIVAEAEKGEDTLTDYDVQIEAGNLIVAGSDTTANTLTYLVWSVLRQPELRKALEKEVEGLPQPASDVHLETLPILGAVIDETLRLYCAAPGTLPRIVPKGGATLAGQFVPEGTTVGTQAYTYHRDPTLFPNPEAFDHTRWLASNKLSDAAKAAYSPFGAGSRVCIGVHLAKMELRLAAARFFQECKGASLAPSTTDKSMEIENFFLIAPKGHRCDIVM